MKGKNIKLPHSLLFIYRNLLNFLLSTCHNKYLCSESKDFGLVISQIFHHKRATSGCMIHVESAPPCGTCTAVHVWFLFVITHCPNDSLVTFFPKIGT